MAINDSSKPTQLLNVKAARWAGVVSVLLALIAIALVVIYLSTPEEPSLLLMGARAVIIALLALIVAAAIQLIRGRSWAQRFLLIVFLGSLVGVVTMGVTSLLWDPPSWWGSGLSVPMALVAVGILEIVAVVLLVQASVGRSRLRYASYVAVSIAAALGLTIVANLFSQDDENYFRRGIETFGRFSLSERTKRILEPVDQPVRLTCVYTSASSKDRTLERRARVIELLREMRERNRNIEVVNVTTDSGKAELVERLRKQLGVKADDHQRFLEDFGKSGGQITVYLNREHQHWKAAAGRSYLDMWGSTAEISHLLKTDAQKIEKLTAKVNGQLEGAGLVDYATLIEEIKEVLTKTENRLKEIVKQLKIIGKMPPEIRANRDSALESTDESIEAVDELTEMIGKVGADAPTDPAETLKKFVESATLAARAVNKTARTLTNVAGDSGAHYVRNSQVWLVQGETGTQAILPDGRIISLGRSTLSDLYVRTGVAITDMKDTARRILKAAKREYQIEVILKFRKSLAKLADSVNQAQGSAKVAFERLGEVDEPTQEIFDQAQADQLFAAARGPISSHLKAIDELPELAEDTLSIDITGKNILVVESAADAEVIDYESVWPLKVPLAGSPQSDKATKRVFAGDSVIASKILSMTDDPFATILITHYEQELPPNISRLLPAPEMSPRSLTTLRQRLEEANFEVKEWNLTDERPEATENRPQVLLVLPPRHLPPMQMPGAPKIENFSEEHMDKISAAIDGGATGIFVTQFLFPRQLARYTPPASPPYPMSNYLKNDWGIDVRTDYLVMSAVPDESEPGKFRIDPSRFAYLPLNTFSADHPIAEPISGQRTFWRTLAPIQRTDSVPEGVTVETLLEVPESWTTTWATGNILELVRRFQRDESGYVSPDYEAGDIPAPFDVAVAATRDRSEKKSSARIVVLTLGSGFMDGYLDQRIGILDAGRTISLTDPPRANAEVIVNSVYWCIGQRQYIARGPARVQPVAMIPATTMTILWTLCVIGLPLVIVSLGGVVMLLRHR